MSSLAIAAVGSYGLLSAVLIVLLWRRDVFFSLFFMAMVLYSSFAQLGYLIFPELSMVAIRMYFGEEIIPAVSIFTSLSLFALYVGYHRIYAPLTARIKVQTHQRRKGPVIFGFFTSLQIVLLLAGYLAFSQDLSYFNASDETFLEAVGLPYKLFWVIFKFTPFSLVVLYATVRQGLFTRGLPQIFFVAMLALEVCLFVAIAVATGNRTDPLATVTGLLAFEYFTLRSRTEALPAAKAKPVKRRKWKFYAAVTLSLATTVVLLTRLESARSEDSTQFDVDASAAVQTIFLKDYYPPYHVLIGAMANDYVDPLTVLASNAANALMFLKVGYLQFFVVDIWDPGSVTRSASPAMFAFTEGYVAAGWAGWIYNGIVWALGFVLWRALSLTDNKKFNAVAFALPLMMMMVTARCQSSYFIKTLYMSFIPALLLYCWASGVRWRSVKLARSRRIASSAPQVAPT